MRMIGQRGNGVHAGNLLHGLLQTDIVKMFTVTGCGPVATKMNIPEMFGDLRTYHTIKGIRSAACCKLRKEELQTTV